MDIRRDNGDFAEAENNEKETARVYLRVLSDGHRRLFGMLKETQECLDGFFPPPVGDGENEKKTSAGKSHKKKVNKEIGAAFQEWVSLVGSEIKHWFGAMGPALRHLMGDPKMARFVLHDVSGEASNAVGYADLMSNELDSDKQHVDPKRFSRDLRVFTNYWERYWVPVQDALLRYLSGAEVPLEYIKDLDLGMLQHLLKCFETQEMVGLRKKSAIDESNYHKIDEKKLKLDIDWQSLLSVLDGRAVKGNEGVIYNFILNSLRNALKDLVEARNVSASVFVEGEELVVRVMDDGKGINSNGLNPGNDSFIFKGGSSGTKSTGLGLSNSDQRIKSIGGSLSVVSFSREDGKINTYSNAPEFKFDLEEFNQKREAAGDVKVSTVFEIRLPITKNHNNQYKSV